MKLQEQNMFYYKTLQLEFLNFDIYTVINIVYVYRYCINIKIEEL